MALTAGTARTAITPPVGIPLSGFVGRGVATDVHDELSVTALVLAEECAPGEGAEPGASARGEGAEHGGSAPGEGAQEDTRHAVVALDLIGLYSDALVLSLKRAVREATGIGPERVFLACSHTHYGPVVAESGDMPGGDEPLVAHYRDDLAIAVASCVRAADEARVPVAVSAGAGSVRLGVNRRLPTLAGGIELAPNPEGHVDPALIVVRFDAVGTVGAVGAVGAAVDGAAVEVGAAAVDPAAAGEPVAALVSYACHPSSLESSVRSVSADFPGVLRAELEREWGGRVLFLQGAAGDIDPPDKRPDWSRPQLVGEALAAAALQVAGSPVVMPSVPLESRRDRVALARRGAASVATAEAELADLQAAIGAADDDAARWWRELRVSEAEAVLAALRRGRAPTIEAEVSVLRVGDVALVFVPAELFSELGVALKERSPAPVTVVVGYTDGALWYVPPRHAYAEGGYEVVDACRVAPGAGEALVDRAVELVAELFGWDPPPRRGPAMG